MSVPAMSICQFRFFPLHSRISFVLFDFRLYTCNHSPAGHMRISDCKSDEYFPTPGHL